MKSQLSIYGTIGISAPELAIESSRRDRVPVLSHESDHDDSGISGTTGSTSDAHVWIVSGIVPVWESVHDDSRDQEGEISHETIGGGSGTIGISGTITPHEEISPRDHDASITSGVVGSISQEEVMGGFSGTVVHEFSIGITILPV